MGKLALGWKKNDFPTASELCKEIRAFSAVPTTIIKKLRKKIAQVAPERQLVHSVYGVGCKFENE